MISIDVTALADAIAERLELGRESAWMTTAEAAEYLRVSERWIRDHRDQIPRSRVDGRLFFNRGSLDAWLHDQRETTYELH